MSGSESQIHRQCRSGFCVNQRRPTSLCLIGFIFKPGLQSGSCLPGLSPPSWASRAQQMQCPDDCGPVREGPDPSTGLGSGHLAAFLPMRQRTLKSGRVPYGTECGLRCRCQVRRSLLCGTVPFYGTGARADTRIQTTVPDPHLTPQTAYRTHLTILKNVKT